MIALNQDEVRLLRLLVEGASNSTAAKRQGIALRTMELHRQKVMKKLGAKSAAQLGYLFARYEGEHASQ
ncbi:response regulator FixJ [Posidoniimonas polymericola]|uniref:Response regulator FixJ n=1 Tax=Posidoniimonas polymericola TaxID=2528002 RepID=A0A5C5YR43_9BACT|nr:LuxR C-terminal-related transcriptional regulator [Posidoniimonas polymericola]TWT77345.1 response regulator FixJ [Posidoniimonas polymericola]